VSEEWHEGKEKRKQRETYLVDEDVAEQLLVMLAHTMESKHDLGIDPDGEIVVHDVLHLARLGSHAIA
jgi:hypothetical protein